jgi:site-specific DNA recombinase
MIMNPREEKKKRYIIYTRCSTDDQAQGDFTTLDAQAHHCKNMLDAFGYELAGIGNKGIVTDDGFSGKDLNRPGIQLILESLKTQRAFDGIIFFRLDRLTRNTRDLYWLIDLFREKEIDFVSVRENLDSSTAIGRVVIGILGILSAFERELTGERVKASALARVRQGKWIGGVLPYGYRLINDGPPLPNGKQPHKIILDEAIAPKLKTVWELAAQNKSLTEIGIRLSEIGILTAKNHIWRKQSLSVLIKNPFYKGYLDYAGELHKGQHDAIVDEALWLKANRMVVAKLPGHRFYKSPDHRTYLLTGIIKCGQCGSHLIGISCGKRDGEKYHYYDCGRSKQRLGCTAKTISATTFEQAIIDYFKRASNDQEIIIRAIGNAVRDSQNKFTKTSRLLRKTQSKLAEVKAKSENLLKHAMKEKLPQGSTFKETMVGLDREIVTLEDKIEKLQAQRTVEEMSANASEFLCSNIRFAMQHLDQAPPEAQKSLLLALIKEIIVYDDRVEIRMFIDQSVAQTLPPEIANTFKTYPKDPEKAKRPTNNSEALNADSSGSSERQVWLPCSSGQRTIDIIIPNSIHGCKKKDL